MYKFTGPPRDHAWGLELSSQEFLQFPFVVVVYNRSSLQLGSRSTSSDQNRKAPLENSRFSLAMSRDLV